MILPHAVLGAGPLARATVQALARAGVPVRLLHRSGTFPPTAGIEVGAVDLLDTAALADALRGCAVAYMCAQPPYHRWPQEFPPLMHSVVQACAKAGASLVLGDNLYMYGDAAAAGGLTETSPTDATSRKGRVRARMAQDVLEAHAAGKLRVVIARGCDFFGPHVTESALGRMVFEPLLHGQTVRLAGDIDQPHSYTYIEDFGAALATLGTGNAGWGEIWHVPNSPAQSTRSLVELAARLAGTGHPKVAASGRIGLALAGMFMPAARETIELLPHFELPYRVDDSKWRARMPGVETPLEEALKRTLQWYRSRSAT